MKFKYIFLLVIGIFLYYSQAQAVPVQAQKKHDFTVVIDAGHGGKDVGAVDNGAKEKDINLGVARKLASLLKKKMKNVKVVMTRNDDTFLTLQERANIANKNKGNLFISIHTNSLDKSNPNRRKASGTSVYALGLHKDKNNLQVARRENAVIELESNYEQKYSGFDPNKDESYIIFEMAQKKNLGQSLKFAGEAQKQLVKTAGRTDRGVKQAGFWVLWATSMPSVLVELDFICNPESAEFLTSGSGQDKLAKSLYNAVENYVKAYGGKDVAYVHDEVEKRVVDSGSSTPVLAATEAKARRDDVAPAKLSGAGRVSLAKRRRRSAQAKASSLSKSYETEKIPLHSEDKRLAVVEKKEVDSEDVPEVIEEETAAQAKEKSGRKKKDKNNKESRNKKSKSYNKRVIVNKDGSTTLADNGGSDHLVAVRTKNHKSISGYHPKVEKIVTVYKIQILSTPEILKQNNPQFCGLYPVSSFKEKNVYKYTYGESENKQEMEKLLKKVKEKIPDAFIISSKK